ncbi:hypothetical protein LTR10_003382 [Elasticomyces elasticus]|nr:hypothetical protein LTR10_003382 [Elasticomyces elasticus]KAK4969650.1 hypothetical protein LTR42_008922 [Elasticomyces elasticus]
MTDPNDCDTRKRKRAQFMADTVAKYRVEHAKASELLATYQGHVWALFEQGRKFAERTQIIMDSLNSTHQVKRFALSEFCALGFEDVIREYVAAPTKTQKSVILVKLHEVIVLESALPLDGLRDGVASLSDVTDCVAQEVAVTLPDITDDRAFEELLHDDVVDENFAELGEIKVRVIAAYRVLLKEWARVIAETLQWQVVVQWWTQQAQATARSSAQRHQCSAAGHQIEGPAPSRARVLPGGVG